MQDDLFQLFFFSGEEYLPFCLFLFQQEGVPLQLVELYRPSAP